MPEGTFFHNAVHMVHIWAVPYENMSSAICGQRRPRSACASPQSDQGLHCLLTELLDTTEYITGEQRPRWYLVHAQDDLILCNLRMLKGTFSLNIAHTRGVQ